MLLPTSICFNSKKSMQLLTKRTAAWLSLWLVLLVAACNPKTDPTPANQYLVSSEKITQLTKEQIVTQINQSGLTNGFPVSAFVQNGCTVYRLTYHTKNVDGTAIDASGVLLVPDRAGALSMMSVQHGTILDNAQAPSSFQAGSEANLVGPFSAALGYIVAYPDFLGYGASKQIEHPYEHRESLASASLDMLLAAKEFFATNNVSWNNKLYIAGYSEGGYATMALQQKLEGLSNSPFQLKASSCGSGAYDKTNFTKYLVNSTTSGNAAANRLYIWVLTTYNRIYKLNRTLSSFLKEPYATQAQNQGTISVSLDQAVTDSFKKGLNDGTDTGFLNALKDNDAYNFVPKTPTLLSHGTSDRLVFYLNTLNAYNAMKAKGATTVQLLPFQDKDHDTALSDFLLNTITFFSSYQ